MKTYNDLVNEIKDEMNNGGKCTFSREKFEELSRAYLNEFDHEVEVVKIKDGQPSKSTMNVTDDFRKFLEKVLIDFGVDKQEAHRMRTEYQFTNLDSLYPLCSELITNYIDTGKRFVFTPKEDCIGSLVMEDVEEKVKINKNPRDPEAEPKEVLYKKHKRIKAESPCPPWLKQLVCEDK